MADWMYLSEQQLFSSDKNGSADKTFIFVTYGSLVPVAFMIFKALDLRLGTVRQSWQHDCNRNLCGMIAAE